MSPSHPDPRPDVAMLGLGIQGAPIAQRLLQMGFAVTGWNRSSAKAAPLAALGMRIATTPAEAAAGAPIVALCLTDEHAVEELMFGPAGIAPTLGPATVVLDFSTISIPAAQSMAARLREFSGARWIDAPVSGGPSGAREGRLAIFCGGETADIAQVTLVLEAIARVHTHMGPLGSGLATKFCSQLIVSTTLVAISEAMSAARALGVDPHRLPAAISGGYADSIPLQIFGPRMASGHGEPRISEVATMLKDVRLVHAALADKPVDLRLLRTTVSLYEQAADNGWSGEDLAVLPRLSDRSSR